MPPSRKATELCQISRYRRVMLIIQSAMASKLIEGHPLRLKVLRPCNEIKQKEHLIQVLILLRI